MCLLVFKRYMNTVLNYYTLKFDKICEDLFHNQRTSAICINFEQLMRK